MSHTTRLSDAASSFLRAFRATPAGPPPDQWPSPAILRRWLRRPAFRAALRSIQHTLRLRADFHLASAAARAAGKLDDPANAALDQAEKLTRLLRLSHLRQRFAAAGAAGADATDPADSSDQRPISRLDVLDHLHLVDPEQRLDAEELDRIAHKNGYHSPLQHHPDFPPPTPQDTFYYNLIHDPYALLWYLHLYDSQTRDHRYSPILMACDHLLPTESPTKPLPRLRVS